MGDIKRGEKDKIGRKDESRRSDGEVLKPCMVCTQTRMERDTCISNKVKI